MTRGDLVVIGGGPAGICGANTAETFGKRIALVEQPREVGGAGINSGTIPSSGEATTALPASLDSVFACKLYRSVIAMYSVIHSRLEGEEKT
jgi:heterodisulfide reductase subunit A-like polyferredoxin